VVRDRAGKFWAAKRENLPVVGDVAKNDRFRSKEAFPLDELVTAPRDSLGDGLRAKDDVKASGSCPADVRRHPIGTVGGPRSPRSFQGTFSLRLYQSRFRVSYLTTASTTKRARVAKMRDGGLMRVLVVPDLGEDL